MNKANKNSLIPVFNEIIETKIYLFQGQKVMLDSDLAKLYGISTGTLNQSVKRNFERFPSDFMFALNPQQAHNLISQFVISSYGGRRKPVTAFTEQGIAMLSSVLRSDRAVQVNIQIMRTFTKMREMLLSHKELREKIEALESKYDGQFRDVFEAIHVLIAEGQTPPETPSSPSP
jgi:hypothetical protein